MSHSSDLYTLIKSLTKSEKRFIKLHMSIHKGEKDYLKLFSVMEKIILSKRGNQEYNELVIMKALGEERLINKLHVLKNYLYGLILKSLRAYHSDMSIDSEIKNLLHDISILYEKGLYEACWRILKKAKKTAIEFEQHIHLLDIYHWERRLMGTESYSGRTAKDIDDIADKRNEIFEKLSNFYSYWDLSAKIFILYYKIGNPKAVYKLPQYKKLIENKLLKTPNYALSYNAQSSFFTIKAFSSYLKGDGERAYFYSTKHVAILEKLLPSNTLNYLRALNNLLINQTLLNKTTEFFDTLKKLKTVKSKSLQVRAKIFLTYYVNKLTMYYKLGKINNAVRTAQEAEKEVAEFKHAFKIGEDILLYATISSIYIINKDYSQALRCVNKVLNYKNALKRQDILAVARIQNLIIHYEMGNFRLLDSLLVSTKRFLLTTQQYHKAEPIILKHFTEITKIHSKSKHIQNFKLLKKELQLLEHNNTGLLDQFNIISWLENKILDNKH